MRTEQNILSFNKGEISPLMYARTDIDAVGAVSTAQLMQNIIPTKYGPIRRRSGTRYVAEVKDSTKATRLVPFEFNDTQTYIIELNIYYERKWHGQN